MKLLVLALSALFIFNSCGPRGFVRGEYDNVSDENLLTDKWSETDMQKVVSTLVKEMTEDEVFRRANKPPYVMVTKLQNKTSEHIDTQSIMDMVTVELMASKRARFIDKAARDAIAEEYEYQGSGMVSDTTKKGPGGQIGADLIIGGNLDSIVQQAGKDKTVYYKVTLILTNLKTGTMLWAGHKQIRKKYRKQRIGL